MIILLMGPPGAGKGSQGLKLIKKYKIPHISTGDMFRYEMKQETSLGKIVKNYINNGNLVPDEITNAIVEHRLTSGTGLEDGFLLDGYPRTIDQADYLANLFLQLNMKLDYVINIEVSKDVIQKRMSGRRICSNCGKSWHIKFKPPTHEGICDKCGKMLYIRPDDNPVSVERRVDVYNEQTAPLLDYYKSSNKLVTVDGSIGFDLLFEELCKVIGE